MPFVPPGAKFPRGHWRDKKRLQDEANKYSNRTAFRVGSIGAYEFASRNGLLDEICSHMDIVSVKKDRQVYSIEFDDGTVYVGISHNPQKRYYQHKSPSKPLFAKVKTVKNRLVVHTFKMPEKEAAIKEGEVLNGYIEMGFIPLNKNKTGGLGGVPFR